MFGGEVSEQLNPLLVPAKTEINYGYTSTESKEEKIRDEFHL